MAAPTAAQIITLLNTPVNILTVVLGGAMGASIYKRGFKMSFPGHFELSSVDPPLVGSVVIVCTLTFKRAPEKLSKKAVETFMEDICGKVRANAVTYFDTADTVEVHSGTRAIEDILYSAAQSQLKASAFDEVVKAVQKESAKITEAKPSRKRKQGDARDLKLSTEGAAAAASAGAASPPRLPLPRSS
jgi:hypothetical protein